MRKTKKVIFEYRWLLSFWFLINLLQAKFTNLHYDEAYYWLYSKVLSWGYFDHPPMIAVSSKIGDLLSHTTLGLRIIPVIIGVFVISAIVFLIDDKKNKNNVFLYIISFPLITTHIAGFLSLPDALLCFFFVLFLIFYKKYLRDDKVSVVLALSIIIACMIYSKYHAFIILLFVILANLKLLFKKSFWLVFSLTIIFLTPHIIWQIQNDYPSFIYHLDTRASGFSINNLLEFIFGQIILAGPLSGVVVIYLTVKYRAKDTFEKTLKYIAIGFYLFFLFYCINGRVEAHWTSVSNVALIIISYKQLRNISKVDKFFTYLIYPSIFLIFCARVVLVDDNLTDKLSLKRNFMNMDNWSSELDSVSKGSDILFTNKYQNVSIYSYSKNKIYPSALKTGTRFSHIDLIKLDSIYEGKKVFAVDFGNEIFWTSKNGSQHYGSFIDDYYSFTGLEIQNPQIFFVDSALHLDFILVNKSSKSRLLNYDENQKLKLNCYIGSKKNEFYLFEICDKKEILSKESININVKFIDFNPQDNDRINLELSSNGLRVFNQKVDFNY